MSASCREKEKRRERGGLLELEAPPVDVDLVEVVNGPLRRRRIPHLHHGHVILRLEELDLETAHSLVQWAQMGRWAGHKP